VGTASVGASVTARVGATVDSGVAGVPPQLVRIIIKVSPMNIVLIKKDFEGTILFAIFISYN
jgi:hypothetical protein